MAVLNEITKKPGVALFDLDGTLIAWDCQILFCHYVLHRESWRKFYLPVFLAFLPMTQVLGASGLKRVFLSYLWRMKPEELEAHAHEFAKELEFYPEVVAELERHRAMGDLLVLASASPEFYVRAIGQRLGFDYSLGTPVECGDRLAFFPDLENHKGEAKVKRLRSLFPEWFESDGRMRNSHGYTDSTADLPMLGICQNGTLIHPSAQLSEIGKSRGWRILQPIQPWKNRIDRLWRMAQLITGFGNRPDRE